MRIGIVTGASSGLGRELTKYVDQCGLDEIWVNSRRRKRLERLQDELTTPLRIFAGDIGADETIGAIEQALRAERPAVEYFIYGAGMGKIGPVRQLSAADRRQVIRVNVMAAAAMTEACLPFMTRGSRIAEICSAAAFAPIPYLAAYAAAKAFLYRYARALGAEMAPLGISVTAVCPYWIKDTEFIALARQSENKPYFRRFPLAATKAFTAKKAWNDIQRRKAVSTPGLAAGLIRAGAAVMPARVVMAVSRFLFA